MDFAQFAKQYLDRKTGDDPASMLSEESLTFVDMLRNEDVTQRATQTQEYKAEGDPEDESNSAIDLFSEDGEPASEVSATSAESASIEPVSPSREEGLEAEANTQDPQQSQEAHILESVSDRSDPEFPRIFVEPEEISTSALTASSESGNTAEANELVSHEGDVAQPATSEESLVAQDYEPLQAVFQESIDVTPVTAESSAGTTAEANEETSEETEAEIPEPFVDSGEPQDAEPSQTVSETTDEDLAEEGVRVHDSGNGVTILEPPGMPDLGEMLHRVDRDFGTPTVSADGQEIPAGTEEAERDELVSSTDHVQGMLGNMSDEIMKWDRRT